MDRTHSFSSGLGSSLEWSRYNRGDCNPAVGVESGSREEPALRVERPDGYVGGSGSASIKEEV